MRNIRHSDKVISRAPSEQELLSLCYCFVKHVYADRVKEVPVFAETIRENNRK